MWIKVGWSFVDELLREEGGKAILEQTRPVDVSANLTIPSVPADTRWRPSGVKLRVLQDGLWRRVVH